MVHRTTLRALAIAGTAAALAGSLVACSSGSSSNGKISIEYLLGGNDAATIAGAKSLVSAFEKKYPDITVKTQSRVGGTDGDNLIKTKLSTGDMSDVFNYNSGSLFQALKPDSTLTDLSKESWAKDLTPEFKKTVSTDKALYGAPYGTSFGGGVMYNTKVYKELGLSIPTTWDEFIANSQKIKAADKTAVLQTYGDTWTSQLFVLGDFANVSAQDSGWATNYTDNKASAKYSKQPALSGFDHTSEVFKKGLVNEDFASLTNVNGLKTLATGDSVQYPMIAAVLANVQQSNPDQVNDIGFFALPADDASDTRMTLWEPGGLYIPKTTTGDKLDAAKKFVAFANSPAGCKVQYTTTLPTGPFATSACSLPSDVSTLVKDEQKYVDDKKVGLALEFLSPIKGPNLEKILIQVGSGVSTAAQGAALYDDDVKKQAQQLGLKAWN